MPEPVEVYADTYQIGTSAYHATINFSLSSAAPTLPGQVPSTTPLATVRMSLEAMKLLAYMLARQMKEHERLLGVNVQVPQQILNAMHIGLEDWRGFWGGLGERE